MSLGKWFPMFWRIAVLQLIIYCKIWGSYNGFVEDLGLLACDAVNALSGSQHSEWQQCLKIFRNNSSNNIVSHPTQCDPNFKCYNKWLVAEYAEDQMAIGMMITLGQFGVNSKKITNLRNDYNSYRNLLWFKWKYCRYRQVRGNQFQ